MPWTSISDLYNWVLRDPILDWLDAYGEDRGYVPDNKLETYLAAADYGLFVRDIAQEFEARVLDMLRRQVDIVAIDGARSNQDAFLQQTLRLMNEHAPAIYQGLVRDPDLEVFGVPDLIIRGSAIERLVPGTLGELDPGAYYVLDIKYKGLDLNKRGDLKASHAWERVQLALYERALASMVGRPPGRAFVLGRRIVSADDSVGCLDRLPWVGPLDDQALAGVGDGLAWLHDLRGSGATWTLEPPSDSRLFPNAKNGQDSPWHDAKKQLLDKRPREQWSGATVQPARISAGRDDWFTPRGIEFFVDFETFNAMNDDFSTLPTAGGRAMIFMVGCGHEEGGEWRFRVWTAESETYEAERTIIEAWLAHMEETRSRLAPSVSRPLVFHWHSHEVTELDKAARRHERAEWNVVNWYDLLWRVFKAEPIQLEHTDSHSLKPVTRKLHEKGLIESVWDEGPVSDGLAAMAGAWSCYAAARERKQPVHDVILGCHKLMEEIESYNQVDCKAMWEILAYLRRHH